MVRGKKIGGRLLAVELLEESVEVVVVEVVDEVLLEVSVEVLEESTSNGLIKVPPTT